MLRAYGTRQFLSIATAAGDAVGFQEAPEETATSLGTMDLLPPLLPEETHVRAGENALVAGLTFAMFWGTFALAWVASTRHVPAFRDFPAEMKADWCSRCVLCVYSALSLVTVVRSLVLGNLAESTRRSTLSWSSSASLWRSRPSHGTATLCRRIRSAPRVSSSLSVRASAHGDGKAVVRSRHTCAVWC